uniref:Accessory gland protein Acp29AB-like n=1 Tax=Drosophila rhopaloa TaxID=1041015 RepID=A0A6P4ENT1_DRORH
MFKSSIYLFLAFFLYNSYGSLAESQDNGRYVCLLNDPTNQCGDFCLETLKPVLDHIASHQKEWSTSNPQKHNETQERFVRIKDKLDKLLDQEEASSTNAYISFVHADRIDINLHRKRLKKSWDGAEETCREMGGHLATIQSESDFTAIKEELSDYASYWLGITDVAKEGEFVSVATGKPAPFFKWRANHPNNLSGKDNCVDIYKGEMYDLNCSKITNFICIDVECRSRQLTSANMLGIAAAQC